MKTALLLLSFVLLVLPVALKAQDQPADTSTYVITKNDGTEYIGKILKDDGREVLIETEALGKIYIPKSDIKSIVKITDTKDLKYGEYQSTGPFTTRYCFTTNALPIVRGENYALVNLYGPEVHFAISDHFSLGVMSTWIASPMVLAAKYSFKTKNEKLNFSVGTLMGTSGYLNQFRGFGGLHFGNVTLGDRKNNITFSAGYGYVRTGGEFETTRPIGTYYDTSLYMQYSEYSYRFPKPLVKGPIFSIAGIAKAGARASFVFDSMFGVFTDEVTEELTKTIVEPNYMTSEPGVYETVVRTRTRTTTALFIMPAMRFQKTERKAFQVALAGVLMYDDGKTESFPFPMCSWFYRF